MTEKQINYPVPIQIGTEETQNNNLLWKNNYLEKQINSKYTEINRMQISLEIELEKESKVRKKLKQKEFEARQLKKEISNQTRKLNQIKSKAAALEGSRSWRYTKPLRALMNIFRKND